MGVTGGCHITITTPKEQPEAYISRKGFYTVVLQGTMDHRGVFINALVGNVGWGHDTHVLKCSNIFDNMDAGVFVPKNPTITIGGVGIPPLILGDTVNPSQSWLFTPYTSVITPEQVHFNKVHRCVRMVAEHAFGWLKAQWCCLCGKLPMTEPNINCIISACVILHKVVEEGAVGATQCARDRHHAPLPDEKKKEVEAVQLALTQWLQRRHRRWTVTVHPVSQTIPSECRMWCVDSCISKKHHGSRSRLCVF